MVNWAETAPGHEPSESSAELSLCGADCANIVSSVLTVEILLPAVTTTDNISDRHDSVQARRRHSLLQTFLLRDIGQPQVKLALFILN